jgi:hypothetical protein
LPVEVCSSHTYLNRLSEPKVEGHFQKRDDWNIAVLLGHNRRLTCIAVRQLLAPVSITLENLNFVRGNWGSIVDRWRPLDPYVACLNHSCDVCHLLRNESAEDIDCLAWSRVSVLVSCLYEEQIIRTCLQINGSVWRALDTFHYGLCQSSLVGDSIIEDRGASVLFSVNPLDADARCCSHIVELLQIRRLVWSS